MERETWQCSQGIIRKLVRLSREQVRLLVVVTHRSCVFLYSWMDV